MKNLAAIIMAGFFTLISGNEPIAQQQGSDGNRAVGVVFSCDKNQLLENAIVEVYGTRNRDTTNKDGIYYVVIPKDLRSYRLAYIAMGYYSHISDWIENKQDPEKRSIFCLKKKDAAQDYKDNFVLQEHLQTETDIYRTSTSDTVRTRIQSDLTMFLRELGDNTAEKARVAPMVEEANRRASSEQPMTNLPRNSRAQAIMLVRQALEKMQPAAAAK